MKSPILLELYLFYKNRTVLFGKSDSRFFMTSACCLIFFYLGPLMPFSLFSCFNTPWIFKSSSLTLSSALLWNYQNRMFQNGKPDIPVSLDFSNLVINRKTTVSCSRLGGAAQVDSVCFSSYANGEADWVVRSVWQWLQTGNTSNVDR
jgi:hypothetical protein